MRRTACTACLAALALVAPGCDRLLDDTFTFESVSIAAPGDGDTALGAEVLTVSVQTECNQVSSIEILVDDEVAGSWPSSDAAQPVCDGPALGYCIDAELAPALRQGRFWPARLEARMTCAGRAGRFLSAPLAVKVAPFDGLSFLPAAATSLIVDSDAGVVSVSEAGLHRVDPATGDVTTLPHLSRRARAFRVGDDLYFYAPCEPPLLCDAAAPNLYRIAAGALAPTGDRARLDCAPLAVTDSSAGARRAMLLGDCGEPRVRWSAPDLSDPVDAPLGAAPTGQAARRGGELAMLAFDGDELVIVAASDAPPLAMRRTGVRAAASVAAISADGVRAAVLDPATGQVVHVDVASGATTGSVALPSGLGVTAFSYVPGTHDLLVATADHSWRVTADAAEPLLDRPRRDDRPVRIRAAVAIDGRRTVGVADDGTPFVFASDGASLESIATLGPDWVLTAGPVATAGGELYLAFTTAEGPVVVRHRVPGQ